MDWNFLIGCVAAVVCTALAAAAAIQVTKDVCAMRALICLTTGGKEGDDGDSEL